jgi:hypothetical protein
MSISAQQITAYIDTLNAASPEGYERFATVTGKRYVKVVLTRDGKPASVHAFIDPATGHVFKPAGYSTPAKGARYDMSDAASYAALLEAAATPTSFAGGYLYARRAVTI